MMGADGLWRSDNFTEISNQSDLCIDHTNVSITNVGGATSERGLSTTGLEYMMDFRDL